MLCFSRRSLSSGLGKKLLSQRICSLARPVARELHLQPHCGEQRVGVPRSLAVPPSQSFRNIHSSLITLGKVVPFNLPDVGEAIQTVEVKEWLVKQGDTVSHGDPLCEVQSDKSATTIYIPFNGVIKEIMYEVDEIATLGEPLVMIELDDDGSETEREEDESSEAPPVQTKPETIPVSSKPLATPAVRRLAMEHNIDLLDVRGTGKDARVLKEDVLGYIEMKKAPLPAPPHVSSGVPPATPPPSPAVTTPLVLPQDRTEPVKGFKAVMVRTMTASGQVPQFGYCDEVDVTNLVELRTHLRAQLLERGVKFSYMPVIVKAVSMALHHYPLLNSHVSSDCTSITYKADHNIGIAMDTPEGLIVPNVKHCQNKSVFEIAVELNRLQDLGLAGRLTPGDVTGGTFSLSNIGAIGGTYAKPMLLPPEVAIGALGKLQVLPKFDAEGNIRKAHVMHVSWSADHRVIDGAEVARFSNLWKSYIENPATMIIDLK